MASPIIPITAASLIVDTATPPGGQPQLFFSVEVDAPQRVTLGPLNPQEFAAIAAMFQVPGNLSFEAFSGQARNIIRKQVKIP
jgi:hypothetical protein